jgi:ABC-2 type transport system permease protein
LKTFFGVFGYEYRMSTSRWGLWAVFGLLMLFYLSSVLLPPDFAGQVPADPEVLSFAGSAAFMLNLFMPVVGGILAADRLVRDQKLGVEELLNSTPVNRRAYLAGKYFGTLLSIITPVFLTVLLLGVGQVISGASPAILPAMILAFLGINLPAHAFVVAYSLACPLVMPVRVYQVLFTGYWFWGNYLSPTVMPTLNGTYLTANGEFVLVTFFDGFFRMGGPISAPSAGVFGAAMNLLALSACTGLALAAADRYLSLRFRSR